MAIGAARSGAALYAAGLTCLGAALSAVDAAIMLALDGGVHTMVIGFFRAAFGALVVLPLVIARPAVLRSSWPLRQHALRAGVKLLALVAFFAAFSRGPLADVTAITFTAPIFVLIGAAVTLHERLGIGRVTALLAGFAGALLIVGPDGAGLTLAMGYAFLGAIMQAAILLMLKSMSASDLTATLVVLNLLLTAPLALLLALPFWTTPNPSQLALLALQGGLGAVNMAVMTHAFSLADASVVAPVDFLRLPLVALLGFALFAETVGPATWIGGTLICAAALLASRGRAAGRDPA